MGIAAYNRGSALISRQIQHEYGKSSADHVRKRVNAVPPGRTRLFQDTVARPETHGRSGWLLMNRRERGYGEYGVFFGSLEDIRRTYAVALGASETSTARSGRYGRRD